MAAINWKRVYLGTFVGGIVWSAWSMFVNVVLIGPHYADEQKVGALLAEPRYTVAGFLGFWFLTLFILTSILAWMYAGMRNTLGPGPRTALMLGINAGFAIAFPLSWSVVNWVPVNRIVPLWWVVDLWVGAILATLVAGWLYKD